MGSLIFSVGKRLLNPKKSRGLKKKTDSLGQWSGYWTILELVYLATIYRLQQFFTFVYLQNPRSFELLQFQPVSTLNNLQVNSCNFFEYSGVDRPGQDFLYQFLQRKSVKVYSEINRIVWKLKNDIVWISLNHSCHIRHLTLRSFVSQTTQSFKKIYMNNKRY